MIESGCILNYANDMIWYIMEDWVRFMDQLNCDKNPGNGKCDSDKKPVDINRSMKYFLFDPTWVMVQEFFQKGTTNFFFEKLMIFENWDNDQPIITKERVKNPSEA